MNENEIFRLKGRIAISNLSREDKDMINSILDGINKKDEEEKGYLYTVRVKLNNGRVVHATLFFKDKKGPTFEDLKKQWKRWTIILKTSFIQKDLFFACWKVM